MNSTATQKLFSMLREVIPQIPEKTTALTLQLCIDRAPELTLVVPCTEELLADGSPAWSKPQRFEIVEKTDAKQPS